MENIFNIRQDILDMSNKVEDELHPIFKELDDNCLKNSSKVLRVFQKYNVGTNDFAEITGYGYSDPGRDKLEAMYSEIFGAEDAIVRPQIMSGTHALKLALFGLLKYGDTFVSISGEPYEIVLILLLPMELNMRKFL